MLVRTAERFPENVAVISQDVSLTYRELDALIEPIAPSKSLLIETIKIGKMHTGPEPVFNDLHAAFHFAL